MPAYKGKCPEYLDMPPAEKARHDADQAFYAAAAAAKARAAAAAAAAAAEEAGEWKLSDWLIVSVVK